MTGLSDSFRRPINYLRISVTDRCNLRCVYCMPPEGIPLIAHQDILTYEEIGTIVRAAAELGITKVRLTGGEPLTRLGLPQLVAMIAGIPGIDDISMTTNGTLLPRYTRELKAAGLKRVNISLDTLRAERFSGICRFSQLDDVLAGIDAAREAGLSPIKINVVVMAGVNDDELVDFARKTVDEGWNVRFIELMHMKGVADMENRYIPAKEMMKRLDVLGKLEPCFAEVGNGPAKYYRLPGARGTIGFITPVSEHFCEHCNRLRLTSDGKLHLCLLSEEEVDLREPLRHGISFEGLKGLIREAVKRKPSGHHLAEGVQSSKRPMSQVGG
ncbi:MAG: GTP 3',8-cyclase MoaA [Chloroflexota bacterium]